MHYIMNESKKHAKCRDATAEQKIGRQFHRIDFFSTNLSLRANTFGSHIYMEHLCAHGVVFVIFAHFLFGFFFYVDRHYQQCFVGNVGLFCT